MTIGERERLATDVARLAELARSAHDPNAVTTACHCVCGAGMGGPAGPPACKALRAIGEVMEFFGDYVLRNPRAKIPDHIRDTLEVLSRVI